VPAGAEGLIFHPYLQGERGPYWDPRLRADFIGLTFRHGRGHFVRALYEGIAFSIRDLLEASDATRADFDEILILGGGAKSALWRQVVSDVLGVEISRPANGDASFGVALVAGVGVGLFASPRQAVERCAQVIDRCRPDPARHALYSELFAVYKQAQAVLAPLDHKLHALFANQE
jgi:xylulokinase